MPEFIVDYVLLERRFTRVIAENGENALEEVRKYHEQLDSERLEEVVLITKVEEDK